MINVNFEIKFIMITEYTGDWFIDGLYHFVPLDYLDKYGDPIPWDVTILDITRDELECLDPKYTYWVWGMQYREMEHRVPVQSIPGAAQEIIIGGRLSSGE